MPMLSGLHVHFIGTSQLQASGRVKSLNSRERSIAFLHGRNRRSWMELRMTHIKVFPKNSLWGVYLSQRSASWKASSSSFSLSAFSKQSPCPIWRMDDGPEARGKKSRGILRQPFRLRDRSQPHLESIHQPWRPKVSDCHPSAIVTTSENSCPPRPAAPMCRLPTTKPPTRRSSLIQTASQMPLS